MLIFDRKAKNPDAEIQLAGLTSPLLLFENGFLIIASLKKLKNSTEPKFLICTILQFLKLLLDVLCAMVLSTFYSFILKTVKTNKLRI